MSKKQESIDQTVEKPQKPIDDGARKQACEDVAHKQACEETADLKHIVDHLKSQTSLDRHEHTYYLIFRQGKYKLATFTKKHFGHIDVLFKDEFNWMAVTASYNRLIVKIMPWSSTVDLPNHLSQHPALKVLEVKIEDGPEKFFSHLPIHWVNCMSVTKYLLGIRNWSLTPYQLYKWLLKDGRSDPHKGVVRGVKLII